MGPPPPIRYESANRYGDRIRAALEAAISVAYDRNRPVGILLSGGLDSAVVALVATRLYGADAVILCSASGPFATTAEASTVALIVAETGAELVEVESFDPWWESLVGANLGASYPVGSAFVGVFARIGRLLSERGVRTALTGDGGDDLFAADQLEVADLLRRGRLLASWRVAASIGMWHGKSPRKVFFQNGPLPLLLPSLPWLRAHGGRVIARSILRCAPFMVSPSLRATMNQIGREIADSWLSEKRAFPSLAAESRWRACIGASEATYPIGPVKRCAPYLAEDVFAASIGCAAHLREPGSIGRRDKDILREVFADILPTPVRWQRKVGHEDVVRRAVVLTEAEVTTAYARVEEFTGGLIRLEPSLSRPAHVPSEMQQAWLRGLYLAAWLEANHG